MRESATAPQIGKGLVIAAVVLDLLSGVIGICWAVIFVLVGGIFELGAVFGHGGGSGQRDLVAFEGLALLGTAALVTIGPLLAGTFLALLRRRRALLASFAIAMGAFVLPWLELALFSAVS